MYKLYVGVRANPLRFARTYTMAYKIHHSTPYAVLHRDMVCNISGYGFFIGNVSDDV